MSRDPLRRPPLRASELPPNRVRLYSGEAKAIVCPGCRRWLVPHDGGLRRHTVSINGKKECRESLRRVWFDLTPAEWQENLAVAVRHAATRRGGQVRRTRRPPVSVPMFREAAERDYWHGRVTVGARHDGNPGRTP